VNAASAALGFELEDRRFRPHVTVARSKRAGAHPVVRELTALLDAPIHMTCLRELVLWRSELSPQGPTYTPIRRIPL